MKRGVTGAPAARLWRRAAAGLALVVLAGCTGRQEEWAGPIVLVTFDSLRADVVGALRGRERGLTPHLDALIGEATWAGPAIAASSRDAPAMASLWTGLGVWQHQVLIPEEARLADPLVTLPEALSAAGYRSFGFSGNDGYSAETGYGQGFDLLGALGHQEEAVRRLARLKGDRTFVWVHIPEPRAPYVRRPKVEARIGRSPLDLPQRLQPQQLAPYLDPAEPLPDGERRRFWAMYRYNVAWADDRLGRLLAALRASGQWDRTLLVVASTHGEEFGERGQILNGGNLGRCLIEVPLVLKLPRGFGRALALERKGAPAVRPPAASLWATIVDAAGRLPPAAVAPTLFRPVPPGALSELYRTNGANLFSWVEGDLQLIWESRFAPPEPQYYLALRSQMAGGHAEEARARLSEPAEAILGRLTAEFRRVPPLPPPPSGAAGSRWTLVRWTAAGEVPIEGPGRADRAARMTEMARRLAAAWSRFESAPLTPEEEGREWYTAQPR
jgi:hypothetical protein